MERVANKNARVIVPSVLAAWAVVTLLFVVGAPPVFTVLVVIGLVVAIPVMVLYLLGEAGWRALAQQYRQHAPFEGQWTLVPTGQMALVSVDHPQFSRVKTRFVGGALRVATTEDALHLSTMFSTLPVLRWSFPALRIPWTAVTEAHAYEAPGWFRPLSQPGAVLQVAYDPNYTGTFVEIEVGVPPVFIQLPAALLGPGAARLGLPASG